MPIDKPHAVRFCNERIRTAADLLAQAYYCATEVLAEWMAHGGSAMVPNTPDLVVDGSATDGRPPITGAAVNLLVNRLSELKADYEASGSARLNTILAVAVKTTR